MEIRVIVAELKKERDRLDRAITALDGGALSANGSAPQGRRSGAARRGSRLTAAGRKRLSELMKKRWAERRKKSGS